MRIVCQQTILMKYHALIVIFEKEAKFEIVVCCKNLDGILQVNQNNLLDWHYSESWNTHFLIFNR